MIIHVVKQGETIDSIARDYNVSVLSLMRDNGIDYENNLVEGQSIVIAIPEITYIVKEGDTLDEIANSYNISTFELIKNNPWLTEREYIFPGDVLVISYNRIGKISVHGNTFAYSDMNILRKTLPYLTYLSIFNYSATENGEIVSYYDDRETIETTKAYGVIPLMLLTTLSLQGEANIRAEYELLLNEEIQNTYMDNVINILRTKGYYGVNISFQYISISNIPLYVEFYIRFVNLLNSEGYYAFATINPTITVVNDEISFERIDFSIVNQLADSTIVLNNKLAMTNNPPSPVNSIQIIEVYLNYLLEFIPADKLVIGIVTNGFDWELPYYPGISSVTLLSFERAIHLAHSQGVAIQFDEESQTPFFRYTMAINENLVEHIVWFIDARSINAMLNIIVEYNLLGTVTWNINIYEPQFWLLINSQFDIEKIPM